MAAIDPAEIAAMRADGSLREYLDYLSGRTPKRATTKTTPDPEPPAITHPGAWPAGTRPPAPAAPWNPTQIAHALADYRAWLQADQPLWDATCHCPTCQNGGAHVRHLPGRVRAVHAPRRAA